jgi:hypothetical protein
MLLNTGTLLNRLVLSELHLTYRKRSCGLCVTVDTGA